MNVIELKESNPYTGGQIIFFADGQQELNRKTLEFTGDEEDRYHTVSENESLTSIAYEFYKDETSHPGRYWYVIADANQIENPLDLSEFVGEQILIPSFRRFKLRQ